LVFVFNFYFNTQEPLLPGVFWKNNSSLQ